MTYPPPLVRGDDVAVIAPSGPCDAGRLAAGVRVLEGLGLRCHIAPSCHARFGYLAGTDAMRAQDLHDAFAAPHIRAVFTARGGYGAQRLLPLLDFSVIRDNPKIFAGYSDVTALHMAINQQCRLATFHAPMTAVDFNEKDEKKKGLTLDLFTKMLFSPISCLSNYQAYNLSCLPHPAPVTGGNLTLVAASLGTPWEIDTEGRILFLEETNEEPYRIDRMLTQLKLAGKLDAAEGFLLGEIDPSCAEEIIKPLGKPMLTGFPSGHCSPNLTLMLG